MKNKKTAMLTTLFFYAVFFALQTIGMTPAFAVQDKQNPKNTAQAGTAQPTEAEIAAKKKKIKKMLKDLEHIQKVQNATTATNVQIPKSIPSTSGIEKASKIPRSR